MLVDPGRGERRGEGGFSDTAAPPPPIHTLPTLQLPLVGRGAALLPCPPCTPTKKTVLKASPYARKKLQLRQPRAPKPTSIPKRSKNKTAKLALIVFREGGHATRTHTTSRTLVQPNPPTNRHVHPTTSQPPPNHPQSPTNPPTQPPKPPNLKSQNIRHLSFPRPRTICSTTCTRCIILWFAST